MVKVEKTEGLLSKSVSEREDGLRKVSDEEVSRFDAVFSKKKSDKKDESDEEDQLSIVNGKEDVSDEEVSRFDAVFSKKKSDKKDESDEEDQLSIVNREEDTTTANLLAGANLGDTILRNLHKSSEFHRAEGVQATHAAKAEEIQIIGGKIVERIIASNEALNAKQEVRVYLKNEVLPQTEIRIAKDNSTNILSVNFYTELDSSANFLLANQIGLRNHLLDNLKDISDVEVEIHRDEVSNETGDGQSKQEYTSEYDGETGDAQKK